MTYEEKLDIVKNHCYSQGFCKECILNINKVCDDQTNLMYCSERELDEMLTHLIEPEEVTDQAVNPVDDVIKHPNHYCRDGAMECIDEMILLFGREVVKHFCLCNIHKYRYRSNAKNGEEDIKKSDQYIQIYKEICNGER